MSCTARKHQVRTAPRQGYGPAPCRARDTPSAAPGRYRLTGKPARIGQERAQVPTGHGSHITPSVLANVQVKAMVGRTLQYEPAHPHRR